MPEPLPVPRFTARGNKYSHRGTAPACPWVPRVPVVQCPLRRPGASCLSLSSRAVGKAPSGTGTRGSQGWRPAFIGSVFRERAYPAAPCRLADIKQARPAYPFCTFLSPFPTGKGLRGQIRRPIPAKCTGKKGNSGKSENPCIYWICGHRQEMCSPIFYGTDGNGTGNGNKKNPVKSRLPGYFCIYL